MPPETEYFIRELDIVNGNSTYTLKLHQKSNGDVNCIVWDASLVLAKYFEKQKSINSQFLSNVKVLELGAGVGCVGLTAALLGANVIITDLPDTISIMEDNIALNKDIIKSSRGSIVAKTLIWGEGFDQSMKHTQIVVLSDCVYYEKSINPLIQTLIKLCDRGTEIIQCQELRDTPKQRRIWDAYLQLLLQEFLVTEIPQDVQHPEFTCPEIKLFRISKKY